MRPRLLSEQDVEVGVGLDHAYDDVGQLVVVHVDPQSSGGGLLDQQILHGGEQRGWNPAAARVSSRIANWISRRNSCCMPRLAETRSRNVTITRTARSAPEETVR